MVDINDVNELLDLAKEPARAVVGRAYSVEAAGDVIQTFVHIAGGITAEPLSGSETEALAATIGNIIDKYQESNPSIAKNWKKSVAALFAAAMIEKGITGGSFGETVAEEKPANLMATEIRYSDLGKTSWSVSTTAGSVVDLIGTPTSKLILSQTSGERKVVCIIKDGFVTIDTPIPFDELQVQYDSATYLPYAFGIEGKIPVGQSENKLNYAARVAPIIIQPGIGIYVGALADETVTNINVYALGMTFYEKTAFSSL